MASQFFKQIQSYTPANVGDTPMADIANMSNKTPQVSGSLIAGLSNVLQSMTSLPALIPGQSSDSTGYSVDKEVAQTAEKRKKISGGVSTAMSIIASIVLSLI